MSILALMSILTINSSPLRGRSLPVDRLIEGGVKSFYIVKQCHCERPYGAKQSLPNCHSRVFICHSRESGNP
jgi:hypothetical protein